jgi:decaprenylphospho-beta-D-erythro-pentofuranosid-2-ulose 2-reductase
LASKFKLGRLLDRQVAGVGALQDFVDEGGGMVEHGDQGKEGARRIVVLGALSAIAEAATRIWAAQGAHLLLAGRGRDRLESVAVDLRIRGGKVDIFPGDLADLACEPALRQMTEQLGGLDVVLVAYGVLPDQKVAESDANVAQRSFATNFTSAAAWCMAAANILETQRRGALIVIGSVAGDRGRASNYVYGAAKGGLGILVQGIAHRLARVGAKAVLIRPGFVDTPMTAHMLPKGLLWSKPGKIAEIIVRASAENSATPPVIYAPWFWWWIMLVIRLIPAFIFHRTKL